MIAGDFIVLFEIDLSQSYPSVAAEKHYHLVPPDEISKEDLLSYKERVEH